jgi:hypothetical protein
MSKSKAAVDSFSKIGQLLGGSAVAAGALAPEDASAAMMPDPSYEAYIRDEMEARTAADTFLQMRGSKAGFWEARRQDLLDMVDSIGGFAENVAFPAIDKPLQGYLGLTSVAGGLASGQGWEQSIQRGARDASQPIDQTTYRLGGSTTDTLAPHVSPAEAAAAGALVHGGIQIGSPL